MSICATRAHYQPQNLAENDIKLSNFCQKATKAPEDVKRIEIDRTDRCFRDHERFDNVILSSDKRVIMKIVTSAQVMYYFTSAKHE